MVLDWIVGTTSQMVEIAKEVIVKILKWIWDKIKEWILSNWMVSTMGIMVLIIYALVKLLVLKVSKTF